MVVFSLFINKKFKINVHYSAGVVFPNQYIYLCLIRGQSPTFYFIIDIADGDTITRFVWLLLSFSKNQTSISNYSIIFGIMVSMLRWFIFMISIAIFGGTVGPMIFVYKNGRSHTTRFLWQWTLLFSTKKVSLEHTRFTSHARTFSI